MNLSEASKVVFQGLQSLLRTEIVPPDDESDDESSNTLPLASTSTSTSESTSASNPNDQFKCQVHLYYQEKTNAEIIDDLPKSTNNQSMEVCSICLEPMDSQTEDLIKGRRCLHNFHSVCLKSWLNHENSKMVCPLCRNKI